MQNIIKILHRMHSIAKILKSLRHCWFSYNFYEVNYIVIYVCMFYLSLDVPTQLQESFITPVSIGLGGVVIFLMVTIAVSVFALIRSRKNILSQKVDTQHYIKPPAGM